MEISCTIMRTYCTCMENLRAAWLIAQTRSRKGCGSWVLLISLFCLKAMNELPTDHAGAKGNLAVRCKPDPSWYHGYDPQVALKGKMKPDTSRLLAPSILPEFPAVFPMRLDYPVADANGHWYDLRWQNPMGSVLHPLTWQEKSLPKTLQSIFRQTPSPSEVVVVDPGSAETWPADIHSEHDRNKVK